MMNIAVILPVGSAAGCTARSDPSNFWKCTTSRATGKKVKTT